MKPLSDVKTRLKGILTPTQRATLSVEMLKIVVSTLKKMNLGAIWIIGGDNLIKTTALALEVDWYEDLSRNLNETLNNSFHMAFKSQLIPMYLPSDLPLVQSHDINGLIKTSRNGNILTLSPAQRDGGTNAMVVPYNSSFTATLGYDSFLRHQKQARDLELESRIYSSTGLSLDIDIREDLEVFNDLKPGFLNAMIGEYNAPPFM